MADRAFLAQSTKESQQCVGVFRLGVFSAFHQFAHTHTHSHTHAHTHAYRCLVRHLPVNRTSKEPRCVKLAEWSPPPPEAETRGGSAAPDRGLESRAADGPAGKSSRPALLTVPSPLPCSHHQSKKEPPVRIQGPGPLPPPPTSWSFVILLALLTVPPPVLLSSLD